MISHAPVGLNPRTLATIQAKLQAGASPAQIARDLNVEVRLVLYVAARA